MKAHRGACCKRDGKVQTYCVGKRSTSVSQVQLCRTAHRKRLQRVEDRAQVLATDRSPLYHLVGGDPYYTTWASYPTSQSLSFLICKMGTIIVPIQRIALKTT